MSHTKRRIGLLGGSFNPAHAGHLHLSLEALRSLGLDEVWWLVSPANPLKKRSELADYSKRVESAKRIAAVDPRIKVSDIEAQHGWRYSIDTVRGLQHLHPRTKFVWVMGADNLAHLHRWRQWQRFAASIPIAVFDRAPYTLNGDRTRFALRYKSKRLAERDAARLVLRQAPAWAFIHMRRHPLSATLIRNLLGDDAFLAHTNPHKHS